MKVVYQTTLNADEFEYVVQTLARRAAHIECADTICYTRNNRDAARQLAHDPDVDVIIVIGGTKSANTKHALLVERRWSGP